VHTAPPVPPFIHCAHDSPQPPDDDPPQFSDAGAASVQVPDAGLPNCWTIGSGALAVEEEEPPPAPPPPPVKVMVMVALAHDPDGSCWYTMEPPEDPVTEYVPVLDGPPALSENGPETPDADVLASPTPVPLVRTMESEDPAAKLLDVALSAPPLQLIVEEIVAALAGAANMSADDGRKKVSTTAMAMRRIGGLLQAVC